MSEDILLDAITEDEFGTEGMSEAEGKEISEANLVPKGKWVGQLQPDTKISAVSTESGEHPLEGQKVARCHVVLQTDVGEKHMFFDAIGKKVVATSKKGNPYTLPASTNGNALYSATRMYGQPFHLVLQRATEIALVYNVGIKKGNDEYPNPSNVLRGVTAESEG